MQASQYVIALAIMPYLSRVLGVEQFGLLGITSDIIALFFAFTDWGLASAPSVRWLATAAIRGASPHLLGHDGGEVAAHICKPWWIFIIMACIGFTSPLALLVLCGWLQIISYAFGAGWFLRGLEIMGPMVAAELIGRLVFIPLFFLFVRSRTDLFMQ